MFGTSSPGVLHLTLGGGVLLVLLSDVAVAVVVVVSGPAVTTRNYPGLSLQLVNSNPSKVVTTFINSNLK